MDEIISEVQDVKKEEVVVPEDSNKIKRVGKPKSEEWKRKHSEAMKLAHARKKVQ